VSAYAPTVGAVNRRASGKQQGTQTVVLVRRRWEKNFESYVVLAVCSIGEYRYQTWIVNSKHGRARIRSYLNWPRAYDDWRMR